MTLFECLPDCSPQTNTLSSSPLASGGGEQDSYWCSRLGPCSSVCVPTIRTVRSVTIMWGHFTLSHSTGFPSPSSNHKFYYNDSVTIWRETFLIFVTTKLRPGRASDHRQSWPAGWYPDLISETDIKTRIFPGQNLRHHQTGLEVPAAIIDKADHSFIEGCAN